MPPRASMRWILVKASGPANVWNPRRIFRISTSVCFCCWSPFAICWQPIFTWTSDSCACSGELYGRIKLSAKFGKSFAVITAESDISLGRPAARPPPLIIQLFCCCCCCCCLSKSIKWWKFGANFLIMKSIFVSQQRARTIPFPFSEPALHSHEGQCHEVMAEQIKLEPCYYPEHGRRSPVCSIVTPDSFWAAV